MAKDLVRDGLQHLPDWDSNDPRAGLNALFDSFVFQPMSENIAWYFDKRRTKKRLGRTIRILAIVAAGLAALIPVLAELWPDDWEVRLSPAWGAVAILLGAGLVWMDRFLDGTSGWLRYVRTGLQAAELRDEAVLEWTEACSRWNGAQPDDQQIAVALTLLGDLNKRAHAVVREETAVWMQEFQDSLKQLDLMLQSRLERNEKVADELRKRREQKGGLNVLVTNFAETHDCLVTLHRDNDDRPDAPARPLGPDGRATFPNLEPGLWRVVAAGTQYHNGRASPVSAETGVTVAPDKFTEARLALTAAPDS